MISFLARGWRKGKIAREKELCSYEEFFGVFVHPKVREVKQAEAGRSRQERAEVAQSARRHAGTEQAGMT